jgi:hypothetical protein
VIVVVSALGCGNDTHPGDGETEAALSPDYSSCRVEGSFDPTATYETPWDTPCENQECVLDDAAASVLSLVQAELARRGVGEYFRFVRANAISASSVELAHVVTLDWYQAGGVSLLARDLDASTIAPVVERTFCLDLPRELASYRAFLSTLRSCDPELEHAVCSSALSINNGCHAIALGFKERPYIATSPGCFTTESSSSSVLVESGTRLDCSTGSTGCE